MAQRQKEILSCLAVGVDHRQSYPPAIRNFCISLKNISPAGYRFFHNEFSNRIPTIGTISSWHSNSDINAKPGIQKQSLEMLKLLVAKKNGKLVGSLLFDEMKIKKMVQCVNGQMIGYEFLPGMDRKTAELASDVLVFLFKGINEDIQIPVAYYFISSSESEDKNMLLEKVIQSILNCGVLLTSVSFDGHKSNPKACTNFGAELQVFSPNFNPSFVIGECKIRTIFDPSHMIKLVRSTLGSNKFLYDSDKNPIKWEYFQRLVRFKEYRNMGPFIKITQTHINYESKPMKVRYAVEILSRTNADLMEHFMNQGYNEFQGAIPTIKFIRTFNDLFDVFNSTSDSKENIFKKTMSSMNTPAIMDLFAKATEYIKGLYIRTGTKRLVPLCTSIFKTGFQGFIINMHNLLDIYNELVIDKKIISSIATHKLSQDHLENLFGKIRSLCGSNTNPNCQQFNAALNTLLANTAIQNSIEGNCTVLEQVHVYNPFSNISTITSRRSKSERNNNVHYTPEEMEIVLQELSEIQESAQTNQLTDLSDLTTAHIASVIEGRIETTDKFPANCRLCKDVFESNEKIPTAFMDPISTRRACQSTYDICNAADHVLKIDILKGQFEPDLIYQTILSSLNLDNIYQDLCFKNHADHKLQLVESILHQYIRNKCNYF